MWGLLALNKFGQKKEWDRVVKYIEENGDEIDGVFGKENYSAEMDTRTAWD